ncbi:glycosyltransferase family 4 protein [Marinobacter caseinilyticus]|uniref:glycosyltransferase family 4 protein n=1 Tax=Marinobacter caseinilyticus TaxID=2692195 RepID=UPI00140C2CD6|nr:glycosyltransferase family 4 protein [Marinobacter caseinilyticus]
MKILIINYYFEPVIGAHAYRWSQIAKEWAGRGHEVEVISGRFEKKSIYDNDGVLIKRIGIVRTEGTESDSEYSDPFKVNSFLFLTKFKVRYLLKRVYRKIYWPDGLWLWLPSLLLELFKRKSKKYDLIISYSPTFSAHLGALFFKKISCYRSAWIADYGDPFSLSSTMPPNNLKFYAHLNNCVESAVIKSCQIVSMTNKDTLIAYKNKFKKSSDKIICIPHLVDIDKFYSKQKLKPKINKNFIRFIYVGGFHKDIRDPSFMLSFFCLLEKAGFNFTLDLYGPLNGFEIESKGPIRHHGIISRSRAIEVVQSADCLVNVENINCFMTPSKLVEYVATGKPILNFIQDNCSELLLEYENSGFVFNARDCGVVSDFMRWIEAVGSLNTHESVFNYVGDNSLVNISEKYLELIDEI